MSHVRLYLPAIVLILGALVTSVCSISELSAVALVLLIWAVVVHLRETRRRATSQT